MPLDWHPPLEARGRSPNLSRLNRREYVRSDSFKWTTSHFSAFISFAKKSRIGSN